MTNKMLAAMYCIVCMGNGKVRLDFLLFSPRPPPKPKKQKNDDKTQPSFLLFCFLRPVPV